MRVALMALALSLACSPAQRSAEERVIAQDGPVTAAHLAQCIAVQMQVDGATASTVALACELQEIPDELKTAVDLVQAARAAKNGDGGA